MVEQSLIIIPTYNESLNVEMMVEKIFSLYPAISLLVVDDNSPDQTASIVERLQKKYPALFLIKRSGKLGLGTAYLAGFKWALSKKFQYIFQMDCDFSHDPTDIQKLFLELSYNRADLAIGSRYSENEIRTKKWAIHRLLLSYTAAFFLRMTTGLAIKDMLGGFKGFRRQTLERIDLNHIISKGYVFQFEMNYKIQSLGMQIKEVPIIFHNRAKGVSKMDCSILFEAIKVFIRLRLKKWKGDLNGTFNGSKSF